jgi:hypothetical protein
MKKTKRREMREKKIAKKDFFLGIGLKKKKSGVSLGVGIKGPIFLGGEPPRTRTSFCQK